MLSHGPTLVVAHDAGGAEVISAWVRRHGDPAASSYLLDGPAVSIFERKLGVTALGMGDALAALANRDFELVLTGTSWASDLELVALKAAREAGVRSASYLDHWVRYPDRFERDGTRTLPDEIWAGDQHAVRLAERDLPGLRVRLVPNEYLADQAEAVRGIEIPSSGEPRERVLYVTEPTSRIAQAFTGDPLGFGYHERDALVTYLGHLAQTRPAAALRLRLHPSEEAGRYDAEVAAHAQRASIHVSSGTTLTEDIAWATHVVGCDSMAMVVALQAGRAVTSVIPPAGRPLSLPYPEIERLFA